MRRAPLEISVQRVRSTQTIAGLRDGKVQQRVSSSPTPATTRSMLARLVSGVTL